MITNKPRLDDFYRELIKTENISHKEALSIYDTLHNEAVNLGVINSENIMEGFETTLRIARAIHGLGK